MPHSDCVFCMLHGLSPYVLLRWERSICTLPESPVIFQMNLESTHTYQTKIKYISVSLVELFQFKVFEQARDGKEGEGGKES